MAMLTLFAALFLTQADASTSPSPANLLAGATVRTNRGAPDVARMSDGIAPVDGDVWNSQWTARLAAGGLLEWDLGMPHRIEGLRLQADNNDLYLVAVSMDGITWEPGWVARAVGVPGLQTRTSDQLRLFARYLRLTAEGGDQLYSVGELEVFETAAAMAGAQLQRITPPPPPPPAPFNTAYLLVLAVAGWGAWVLREARLHNLKQRASQASEPGAKR